VLDEPDALDLTLVDRYGHLLPEGLIRGTVAAAPAAHVAEADLAALADAVHRAPEPAPVTPPVAGAVWSAGR
jgi:hypothetical protein